MRPLRRLVAHLLILCVVLAGGGSGAAGAPSDVQRLPIDLPGAPEAHTPDGLNQVGAFRYFQPGGDLPTAVLVLIPGLNSGANTMDILARALVAASRVPLEVWVVKPRPTFLQDRRGIQAALEYRNPDFALAYYYGRLPIDGHVFHLLPLSGAPYAAYWGLDVQLRDIRAVIQAAHRRYPQAQVFLGGHSLGAILAALYAGYDFGRIPGPVRVPAVRGVTALSPDAGALDIRGLVMLDGVPFGFIPRLTERQYLRGFRLPGIARFPGVEELTAADPRKRVGPFTDTSVLARIQDSILFNVITVYAYLRPDEGSTIPFPPGKGLAITNEALLGAVLSSQMQPDLFIRASLGSPLGVFRRIPDPANVNRNGLLDLQTGRPAPGETLIRWIPYDRSTPPGRVDLRALEEAILRPGGDFTQWYMPWRFILDLGLAATLDTSDEFGRQYLSLTQVRYTNVPVLIIGAGQGLVRQRSLTDFYRGQIATPPDRVTVTILPGYTHLDIENATDNRAAPLVLGWIESVLH